MFSSLLCILFFISAAAAAALSVNNKDQLKLREIIIKESDIVATEGLNVQNENEENGSGSFINPELLLTQPVENDKYSSFSQIR